MNLLPFAEIYEQKLISDPKSAAEIAFYKLLEFLNFDEEAAYEALYLAMILYNAGVREEDDNSNLIEQDKVMAIDHLKEINNQEIVVKR